MTKSIGSAGAAKATGSATTIENVADILERELQTVFADWLFRGRAGAGPNVYSVEL